jgi:tetratricopeptide (TPR) repeat protein
MSRHLIALTLLLALPAFAQTPKAPRDADLGKKETSAAPDKALAGDLTRKKEERGQAAPALQYDQFRLGVELQVASKRRQQIEDLKQIIKLTPTNDQRGKEEAPRLLFRLGELYWEESKYYFFEGNRKDDELINAMNRKDKAGQERAKAEKEELIKQSKEYGQLAMDQYSRIVQEFKDFDRTDEVLYFLGHNLMELGDDRKSLVAFKRLIEKYPKSKYIPDAHVAFGEYYFNNSKGKRELLEKALDSYKKAAAFPDNQAYGFALYKQGWCYFNLADYDKAQDMFKAVVLYGELAGTAEVEGTAGTGKKKGGRAGLIREARNDYVRSYARGGGTPNDARAKFGELTKNADDRFIMMKQLANLYYEDGKDREAAVAFNILIKEKPLSPEAPGFQGKIVDCVLRAGNKKMTVDQVRRLVKVMDDVVKSGVIKEEKDKKALEEARELSERTISNLAVTWHNEAKKTRDEETYGFANEVYADYLTLFSDNVKAYDLRFFWAELLNDNLSKYDKAADEYTKVLMQDVECIKKGGVAPKEQSTGKEDAPKGKKGKKAENQDQVAVDETKSGKCKVGRWTVNAAYNAILAYDEVVKRDTEAGKLKTPAAGDPNKKLEIPPQKKALLDACERYVKYVPSGEKKVEIAFKAAKIYYDHNYLEESVQRFSELAMKYPDYKFENGDRAAEIAANLVLDSYNLLGDWSKVNEWARKFYNNQELAQGPFREQLSKLIEQSAFKLVNQLEAKKEYAKAAEAYLGFVKEFPRSEIADKALFNASIDFQAAKQLDRAIEVRRQIVKEYPKSTVVPRCIFDTAANYEETADFENSADYYELYAQNYERSLGGGGKAAPKKKAKPGKKAAPEAPERADPVQVWEEAKAQIALFNAGIFREGLGQYKQALKNRERYLELWGEGGKGKKGKMSKDAEAVYLSIADLHEKAGAYGKAMKHLEEYERQNLSDANKVLTAEGRIASIFDDKLKSFKNAQRIYDRILKYYEKLPQRTAKALDITALDAVARAHYVASEGDYKKYAGMRLKWSRLENVGEFKTTMKEKARGLEEMQKIYTKAVGFKSADPAICALYKIGLSYDHFHGALLNAPTPRGMPEELKMEFVAQLETQAQPVKDKAGEAFAATVQKSQELDVYNECTTKALTLLRDKYRPAEFPKMAEQPLEIRGDFKAQAIGGDLLTAIQAVPVISEARAAELRNKAKDVASKVDDLDRPAPEPEETEPAGGDAPPGKSAPKKSLDEEPSDEPT